MSRSNYMAIAVCLFLAGGCKSVSKHPIDEQPSVKIDTGLLGIWKAKEDTLKSNFLLVRDFDDAYHRQGNTKADQDYNREANDRDYYYYLHRNEFYFLTYFYNDYAVRTSGDVGSSAFTSLIGKSAFLNVKNTYTPVKNFDSLTSDSKDDYFFVRVLNKSRDAMTVAIVKDEYLKDLVSSNNVRKRIEQYKDYAGFYSDTLHLYKASNFHGSAMEAKKLAKSLR